ncbi:hypothetical protein [Pyrinomonas sp.]|uniref:hypothetical protein n=1 Tax=Pyrinomonas sp. TaxID=2080306 RepID=UPI00331E3576
MRHRIDEEQSFARLSAFVSLRLRLVCCSAPLFRRLLFAFRLLARHAEKMIRAAFIECQHTSKRAPDKLRAGPAAGGRRAAAKQLIATRWTPI